MNHHRLMQGHGIGKPSFGPCADVALLYSGPAHENYLILSNRWTISWKKKKGGGVVLDLEKKSPDRLHKLRWQPPVLADDIVIVAGCWLNMTATLLMSPCSKRRLLLPLSTSANTALLYEVIRLFFLSWGICATLSRWHNLQTIGKSLNRT